MKQNRHQEKKPPASRGDEQRVQINVLLEGEEAAKFLRYQSANKLRMKASAGYRLIVERLEQLDPAA